MAWAKLWMSRPAPVSSINATATWATTRPPLSARTPHPDDAPRRLLWIKVRILSGALPDSADRVCICSGFAAAAHITSPGARRSRRALLEIVDGGCHRRPCHLVLCTERDERSDHEDLVAGATGALGRVLVPQLVGRGHDVVGMTRSASKQDLVRALGARPVVADALDPEAVAYAVAGPSRR